MEPLEGLRYARWLAPEGALVSAGEPFVNIPNYPGIEGVLQAIQRFPLFRLVEAAALAKEAGLSKAVNMVMVGAASPFLPLSGETLEKTIAAAFAGKEPAVAEANIIAFRLGRDAAAGQRGAAL
jgi:indolepyruvate ferredoxin oxidoreductase beta subunit